MLCGNAHHNTHAEALLNLVPLLLILLASAIPVALPVMFTVSMAVGSMELTQRGVLVARCECCIFTFCCVLLLFVCLIGLLCIRLNASEDAASMSVLCSDKTGTITLNELTLCACVPVAGYSEGTFLC